MVKQQDRMSNRIYINDKPVMEIEVNGKKIDYDIDAFCAQYKEKGTLPSQKVVCTKTGKQITMFGENLHRRVSRFGGIKELLTKFVCAEAGGRLPRTTKKETIEDLQRKIELLTRNQPSITVVKTEAPKPQEEELQPHHDRGHAVVTLARIERAE